MPADGNVNMGNIPPKAFAVSGKQILCGKLEQLFVTCFKQLAADGLWRIVVECGVGGKNRAFGTGNPDKLVGRYNVAQPLAAVNHIVPREFAVVFFLSGNCAVQNWKSAMARIREYPDQIVREIQ